MATGTKENPRNSTQRRRRRSHHRWRGDLDGIWAGTGDTRTTRSLEILTRPRGSAAAPRRHGNVTATTPHLGRAGNEQLVYERGVHVRTVVTPPRATRAPQCRLHRAVRPRPLPRRRRRPAPRAHRLPTCARRRAPGHLRGKARSLGTSGCPLSPALRLRGTKLCPLLGGWGVAQGGENAQRTPTGGAGEAPSAPNSVPHTPWTVLAFSQGRMSS